jgi:hypothetical protein
MGVGIIVACSPALRVLLRTAGERSTGQNSGSTEAGSWSKFSRVVTTVSSKNNQPGILSGDQNDQFPLVSITNDRGILKQKDVEITSENKSR